MGWKQEIGLQWTSQRMGGRGLLQLHIAGNQGRDTGIRLALALALAAEEMNVTNGHALTTGMRWESEWRCRGGNGRAAKKQNKSRQTKTGSYRPPPSTAALKGLDSFRPQGLEAADPWAKKPRKKRKGGQGSCLCCP